MLLAFENYEESKQPYKRKANFEPKTIRVTSMEVYVPRLALKLPTHKP